MPPRPIVAAVVAFWLAVTGLAFYRDVWPRLFASGPPPVSVELADEARQAVPARWKLFRNGKQAGSLETRMKYLDAEDAFQFTYHYKNLKLEQSDITLLVPEGLSEMRLTRAGELKSQTMNAKVEALFRGATIAQGTIDIRGTVTNGTLTGRAEVVARTWVRVSDGKVLRQEAFEKGENLTFERED